MTMTTPMMSAMMPATTMTAITTVSVHQHSYTILYTRYTLPETQKSRDALFFLLLARYVRRS